jgi:hypothetical protein
MIQLVEQMLALHKQLAEAKTGHEQTMIQRQIDATDRQIDKLVYELYGLTPEEIAIVEGQLNIEQGVATPCSIIAQATVGSQNRP